MHFSRRLDTPAATWVPHPSASPTWVALTAQWRRSWLVGKLARVNAALNAFRRTPRARAGSDLAKLRQLSLAELTALPELTLEEAEKLFYVVQWERLQAHLELCGTLPGDAELGPLLASLNPLFERHFHARIQLSAPFVKDYRALFPTPHACRWPRPCLELLLTPQGAV